MIVILLAVGLVSWVFTWALCAAAKRGDAIAEACRRVHEEAPEPVEVER